MQSAPFPSVDGAAVASRDDGSSRRPGPLAQQVSLAQDWRTAPESGLNKPDPIPIRGRQKPFTPVRFRQAPWAQTSEIRFAAVCRLCVEPLKAARRGVNGGAVIWHNWEIGAPGRSLIAYDH
jgi:hypothetical protein